MVAGDRHGKVHRADRDIHEEVLPPFGLHGGGDGLAVLWLGFEVDGEPVNHAGVEHGIVHHDKRPIAIGWVANEIVQAPGTVGALGT